MAGDHPTGRPFRRERKERKGNTKRKIHVTPHPPPLRLAVLEPRGDRSAARLVPAPTMDSPGFGGERRFALPLGRAFYVLQAGRPARDHPRWTGSDHAPVPRRCSQAAALQRALLDGSAPRRRIYGRGIRAGRTPRGKDPTCHPDQQSICLSDRRRGVERKPRLGIRRTTSK